MSLKENRKKIQKSIVFIVQNYPEHLALDELYLIRKTLLAQIEFLEHDPEEQDHAQDRSTDEEASTANQEVAGPAAEQQTGLVAEVLAAVAAEE